MSNTNNKPDINISVGKALNIFKLNSQLFPKIGVISYHKLKAFFLYALSIPKGMSQYSLDNYAIGVLYDLEDKLLFFEDSEDSDIFNATYTWIEETDNVTVTYTYCLGFVDREECKKYLEK